jgi:lysozyme
MKTGDAGIKLMQQFEGYFNKPYLCPANIWTVGWGTVLYQQQIRLPMVRKPGYTGAIRNEYPLRPEDNRTWEKSELEERFKDELSGFESGVLRLAPTLAGSQNKFDAVVALCYNIGLGNFQSSTLRQKILRKEWDAAADAFMLWNKAGGKVLKGLVKRREAERVLFLSD